MLLRMLALTLVAMGLSTLATSAQDPARKDDKEVVGTVKDVSVKDKKFLLTLPDKSERAFLVNKETKFTGPRGSDREDGLQDDCMKPGYEVHVVPASDDKFAKEVKLALRKKEDEKKKKKDSGG